MAPRSWLVEPAAAPATAPIGALARDEALPVTPHRAQARSYKFSCRAVPAQVRSGPCPRGNGTPHITLHIIRRNANSARRRSALARDEALPAMPIARKRAPTTPRAEEISCTHALPRLYRTPDQSAHDLQPYAVRCL
ncbi:hypothetical protein TR80_016105 [Xanthomonas campestris]|nr:hypothetical protein TR80_016105 [Xanthomonas campestris]